MPRIVISAPYVSRNPILVLELDKGRVGVENLGQRDSISRADDSVIAVGASGEVEPHIRLMPGETSLGIENLSSLCPSADEPSLSGEPGDRERTFRPSS
jgi:hypothetical protein